MFACAIFGGLHWNGVVAMFSVLENLAKEDALQFLRSFSRVITAWMLHNGFQGTWSLCNHTNLAPWST